MWAPANLFTPGFNAVALSMKRLVSDLAEHPLVLTSVILGAVALIAVVTVVTARREKRS